MFRRLAVLVAVLALGALPAQAQLSPSFQTVQINTGGKITLAPSTASTPSLVMPSGVAPVTCTDGWMWKTVAGYFGCNNGVPVGPFAAGASVNASAANNLAIYSGANAISGLTPQANSVLISNGSNVPSWAASLPSGTKIPAQNVTLATYTIATLPVVTTSNVGQMAWATDCLNANQTSGNGTGCVYTVNDAGVWQPNPYLSTQTVTVGGQVLYLGGTTTNQGNGSKIQLSTGTTTSGHCVQFDANGNTQDAGGACTTGGGGGTVVASPQYELAYYSSAGTTATVTGIALTANAVLVTNGSSVPSEATTLPSGLTIPTPTISSPALTANGTYVNLTGTGKLTTAASATSAAGFNLPAGTAPTSPANGDLWTTTSALFARINGATQTMLSSITTSSPLGGGGSGPSLTLTCTTCATTTSGGALTATAPMAISSAGVISLGNQPSDVMWYADSVFPVHADTYTLMYWPFTGNGTVDSVTASTGGTGSPGFAITVAVNGSTVGGCGSVAVNGTKTTTSCGGYAIASGQPLTLQISSVTGTPFSAAVQINIHKPAS